MTIQEESDILEEDSELFEHYRFVVDTGQSLLRIDKFLCNRLEAVSRSKVQSAAEAGNILVNNKPIKSNYKVKPGDIISILMSHPPREIEIISENIPINIVFEDDDIILVNKPAGMVVHPGYGNYTGTLLNALTFHFENTPQASPDVKPFLVHRIDKDTTGILLIAKNEKAQARLSKLFYDHNIDRKYFALVWGDFEEPEGTIIGNIGRSLKNRKVMTVFPNGEYGKPAITHFSVIEKFRYVTLVQCVLETGRTHQIRAHMRYIGHPLFNDQTYGGDEIIKGTTFSKYKQFINNCFGLLPRQALHAKFLGFNHPITGQYLSFDSELPEDMSQVIEKWRKYVIYKNEEEEA